MTERTEPHTEHRMFRDQLVDELRADVLGPTGGTNEVLSDTPITSYITGILFPRSTSRARAHEEILSIDLDPDGPGPEDVPDLGIALANVRRPSSMGLTFAVDTTRGRLLTVTVRGARYRPTDRSGNPVEAERPERRTTDEQDLLWRREALLPESVTVDLRQGLPAPVVLTTDLELRLRVRQPDPHGVVAITATLVNTALVGEYDLQDAYCVFQPVIRVEAPDGKPIFVERPFTGDSDVEADASRLLHRHAPAFAAGHGCAAAWAWIPPRPRTSADTVGDRAAVPAVWTEFVPSYEVLPTDSNPEIDDRHLGMDHLSHAADHEVFASLHALVAGYAGWIEDRAAESGYLPDARLRVAGTEHVQLCRAARERMLAGIRLLEHDPEALEAFRLANRVMAIQRGRTSWVRAGGVGEPEPTGTWRPFQIGFLLLCIEGIADPAHPDRELADLLWFPTGGGKTEAYLGLVAFTTFLRRMRLGPRGGGVTVLMRYTLRLLTLQQFERAAALLCAMEWVRRQNPQRYGTEEMSLGMWVGKDATPNSLKDAAGKLQELRERRVLDKMNPVQLRRCPWCGTPLDDNDYRVESALKRMYVLCRTKTCDFAQGIPVHLVDEALYDARPTLVIATADKFAQLAWRADVAALFNRDRADSIPPPELVIQDELHLISGPLGTLAGLYETAVDIAADRPKVIASTATIRRAREQGRALFDREVRQFPPPGLDTRDTWFSVETPPDSKAGRRYVGVLTPSVSQAALLVRTYASLLHSTRTFAAVDAVRDPYWTLIGYFNSLRLLAAAELQVADDVQARLRQLVERSGSASCVVDRHAELTSRIPSSDIPRYLQELETALPASPLDTVLATNMISVGVDVDRLGLMVVMGQPQTTAEYIQATSRVGRRYPGLVVTLLNGARSRDRSHYESFASYHSALYRQVESTSVTPFSTRARDRALHAMFIGLARLMIREARPNSGAARVERFHEKLVDLRALVLTRVHAIAPEEHQATAAHLDDIIEHWRALAEQNTEVVYEAPYRWKRSETRAEDTALLRAHEDEDLGDAYAATPWSLRDVDAESDLYLEN
ncbi:helicase-related protein [Embleya sp. NPDC020886]|uniref:helicase-related protein n=1 Tax=Embleya sp. NPDC020886 TaxID=3363980 RepID=UPI00379D8F35